MDQKQPLNHLFTLLLLLSCLLSLEAAPLSRILASRNQDRAVMKAAVQVINKEMIVTEGVPVSGAMDIELNDYPGSGANSHHDPKNPRKP
ncbi:unnamed protein product [Musa acuminata subsp. malaccensis]|uniref:(wild Malaysian banana) hypothetical protein n=1 Tax=Musa acuminata subsp. malaccensis TaxID=214687 RepID=A0A804LB47_MUSAM|nr:unnamed protein product [Musa acuminata subsp. malaccensis]